MRSRRGFSLIELLVVMAIVSLLIALLLPALGRARDAANIVVCAANQQQIGLSYQMFIYDHNDQFPTMSNWAPIIGKRGTSPRYASSSHGPEDRPLNAYMSSLDIAECPSDLGDSYYTDSDNCFIEYGTSYLPQWNSNAFRTRWVIGNGSTTISMKLSEMVSPTNKIIQGDWPWHANRRMAVPRTWWHASTQRSFNMLWGDGRVELFIFPPELEQWPGGFGSLPPDPDFDWW